MSTDGTEQDQVLFNANKIGCIDQTGCLDNEICVKREDDVGICQCPLDFKRNIAGMYYNI